MVTEKDFKIMVPYDDYNSLVNDSAKMTNVVGILKTKFPDDTCQLIAIKSILGIEEEKPEPEPEPEPTPDPDPDDGNNTDPSDPGDGGATTDPDPTDPPTP